MSLKLEADRTVLAAAPGNARLDLRVRLRAPAAGARTERLPLNLGLVLDRSGSMDGPKLDLARAAAVEALRRLSATDRLSVVAYDDRVEVLLPSGLATGEAKARAEAALAALTPRGSTDLCGGWLRGCEQVGTGLDGRAVGRCLLLTDGLANHGVTQPDTIVGHAAELYRRGVVTSTVGVGSGFNEVLLQRMSEAGGGNFYFAEGAAQLPGIITGEAGEALEVVCRDAELVVEAGEGLEVASLNGLLVRAEGAVRVVALNQLVSEQELDPVLRLTLPARAAGERLTLRVTARDRDGRLALGAELELRFAPEAEARSSPRAEAVARASASLRAAEARRSAVALNRGGDLDGAVRAALSRAAELRLEAEGDPEILALAEGLEREADSFRTALDAVSAKQALFASNNLLKMKLGSGLSRKSLGPEGLVGGTLLADGPALLPLLHQAVGALCHDPAAQHGDFSIRALSGPSGTGPLLADEEARLVARAASEGEAPRLLFTARPLADGWFSHWHAAEETAVISLAGWGSLTTLNPAAFVAYELVLHGLHRSVDDYDTLRLAHRETRGCLFDLCVDKAEVEIKLQAGDLCPSCEAALRNLGVPLDDLRRLWSAVRALAHKPAA